MRGQMCWIDPGGGDGAKVLYLRLNSGDRWQPYTAFPNLRKPDHAESSGMATAQHLLKTGWVYAREVMA